MRTEAPEGSVTTEAPPEAPGGTPAPPPAPAPTRRERRAARRGLRPGETFFRHRVLPRSVIGIITLLLAGAVGFAFGGTVLYAYYQSRLDNVEQRVADYIASFEGRYEAAREQITEDAEAAREEIRREIEPIRQLNASAATLTEMVNRVEDSVFMVETQNAFGEPQAGSAFVLTSDAEKSYLVTSLSVVEAATRRPGPAIFLRKGDERIPAQLHTWQEERDLALLIINKGTLPRLKWVPGDTPPELGQRVFVVSGTGGAGGGITQGLISDISAAGIQHDAAATGFHAGGPLLNSKGEVLGIATPEYAPLGFTSDRITFASPIRASCEVILSCPANATEGGGAGERR